MDEIPEEFRFAASPEDDTLSEAPRIGMAVIFIVVIILALAFASFAASIGAPWFFVAFAFVAPFLWAVNVLIRRGAEEDRRAEAQRAADEERERLKEEVAQSVKETMKGTIKVRCRYCGGLNGEHDEKCESCGAPL